MSRVRGSWPPRLPALAGTSQLGDAAGLTATSLVAATALGRRIFANRAFRLFTLGLSAVMGASTEAAVILSPPSDSVYTYWTFRLSDPNVYAAAPFGWQSHPYTPVVAQALAPLTALPWGAFIAIWTAIQLTLLLWLVGPRWFGLLLIWHPFAVAVWDGNTQLVYAAVAALGLRYPALWAIPILTKVTPGLGVLWFAVRREWRSLAITLGVTLGLAAISFVLDASAWSGYLHFLATNDLGTQGNSIPLPLWLRLLMCVALVVLGARVGQPWVLGATLWLAMPTAWLLGSIALLGSLRLALRNGFSVARLSSRESDWRTGTVQPATSSD